MLSINTSTTTTTLQVYRCFPGVVLALSCGETGSSMFPLSAPLPPPPLYRYTGVSQVWYWHCLVARQVAACAFYQHLYHHQHSTGIQVFPRCGTGIVLWRDRWQHVLSINTSTTTTTLQVYRCFPGVVLTPVL